MVVKNGWRTWKRGEVWSDREIAGGWGVAVLCWCWCFANLGRYDCCKLSAELLSPLLWCHHLFNAAESHDRFYICQLFVLPVNNKMGSWRERLLTSIIAKSWRAHMEHDTVNFVSSSIRWVRLQWTMVVVTAMEQSGARHMFTQDGTVDLKGRPVLQSKTGRWNACSFIVRKFTHSLPFSVCFNLPCLSFHCYVCVYVEGRLCFLMSMFFLFLCVLPASLFHSPSSWRI